MFCPFDSSWELFHFIPEHREIFLVAKYEIILNSTEFSGIQISKSVLDCDISRRISCSNRGCNHHLFIFVWWNQMKVQCFGQCRFGTRFQCHRPRLSLFRIVFHCHEPFKKLVAFQLETLLIIRSHRNTTSLTEINIAAFHNQVFDTTNTRFSSWS